MKTFNRSNLDIFHFFTIPIVRSMSAMWASDWFPKTTKTNRIPFLDVSRAEIFNNFAGRNPVIIASGRPFMGPVAMNDRSNFMRQRTTSVLESDISMNILIFTVFDPRGKSLQGRVVESRFPLTNTKIFFGNPHVAFAVRASGPADAALPAESHQPNRMFESGARFCGVDCEAGLGPFCAIWELHRSEQVDAGFYVKLFQGWGRLWFVSKPMNLWSWHQGFLGSFWSSPGYPRSEAGLRVHGKL